jgi:hypothetical protein
MFVRIIDDGKIRGTEVEWLDAHAKFDKNPSVQTSLYRDRPIRYKSIFAGEMRKTC